MADDTKECRYCHRTIPADATFCWYCTRELVARPERPEAIPEKKPLQWRSLIIGTGIIVIGIVVAVLLLSGCTLVTG